MSPYTLGMVAGALLSWVTDNLPKFNVWFKKLDGLQKRWAMRGFIAATSLLIVALNCWVVTAPYVTALFDGQVAIACNKAGLIPFIGVVVSVVVGNQGWFQLSAASSSTTKKQLK